MDKQTKGGTGRTGSQSRRLKVLIAEADDQLRKRLVTQVRQWGFRVAGAPSKEVAKKRLASGGCNIVLADMRLDSADAHSLLRDFQEKDPTIPVIFISDEVTSQQACEAIKAGAWDYVSKPIDLPGLRATLERVRAERILEVKAARRAARLAKKPGLEGLVGQTPKMRRVFDLIRVLANNETPVLIWGETGTGKEVAARTIHQLSVRKAGPFVALNAAAVPPDLAESHIFGHEKGAFTGATSSRPGCFELAEGGILFLDEIGEMPLNLQTKLLRVLETKKGRRLGGRRERSFDVRVLTATNRNPRQAVKAGNLRPDLFFRLSVFTLEMPALRNRLADIELLAHHFLAELKQKHARDVEGVTDETLEALKSYHWPGNVRELRNVVERAVVLCRGRWIEPRHLPAHLDPTGPAILETDRISLPVGISLADAEREIVRRTLQETGNNKSHTARLLKIDVKTVRKKIKDYGLG